MPLVDDPIDESTPWLIDELKNRFRSTDSGLILDMTHLEPVWCLTVSGFERWFAEVESCLDQTLGRRLAHAAARQAQQEGPLRRAARRRHRRRDLLRPPAADGRLQAVTGRPEGK